MIRPIGISASYTLFLLLMLSSRSAGVLLSVTVLAMELVVMVLTYWAVAVIGAGYPGPKHGTQVLVGSLGVLLIMMLLLRVVGVMSGEMAEFGIEFFWEFVLAHKTQVAVIASVLLAEQLLELYLFPKAVSLGSLRSQLFQTVFSVYLLSILVFGFVTLKKDFSIILFTSVVFGARMVAGWLSYLMFGRKPRPDEAV